MVVVLLIFYGIFLSFEAHALTPILKNGTFEEPFVSTVNNSVEYIIEFTGEMRCMPPTVKIQSDNVNYSAPLMVVTRQPKQVLSWQLPLMVDTEIGNNYFNETSRILCYDLIARLGAFVDHVFDHLVSVFYCRENIVEKCHLREPDCIDFYGFRK